MPRVMALMIAAAAAYGGNPAWPALPAGDPCAHAPEPGRAPMARPAEAPKAAEKGRKSGAAS
jgi:hypothetical protein